VKRCLIYGNVKIPSYFDTPPYLRNQWTDPNENGTKQILKASGLDWYQNHWSATTGSEARLNTNVTHRCETPCIIKYLSHSPLSGVTSRTARRSCMCNIPFESQLYGDDYARTFTPIWPWPRVKIRGQSSNRWLTHQPFIISKNKWHHDTLRVYLLWKTFFKNSCLTQGHRSRSKVTKLIQLPKYAS